MAENRLNVRGTAMSDVIVFAGTSEGRRLYGFCADKGIDALFCVATDYGREVLDSEETDRCKRTEEFHDIKLCKLKIHTGRMTKEEMEALFLREKPRLVIDATHPYAAQATEHIRGAAERYGKAQNMEEQVYCRVLRQLQESAMPDSSAFADMARAVAYLNSTEGSILVTTGSKGMDELCKLKDYAKRAYVRILPNPDILRQYLDRGFPAGHMICMQGPFTEEMNRAVMEQYNIRYLLTKQSGAAGGYPEKCRAAQAVGVELVTVLPPKETEGCSVEEAEELIIKCVRGIDNAEKGSKTENE